MVTLYKKLPNSLEETEHKKYVIPKGHNNVKGGPPCDRNQIFRGATGAISHPEEIG
jgi:hypothetical protein